MVEIRFKKEKDTILFVHEGDFQDFSNQQKEVIGQSKTTQTIQIENIDKGRQMLVDSIETTKVEIEKYQQQLGKITIDLTPFETFADFAKKNKGKIPLHRFKKLESVCNLVDAKKTAEKMLEYYNEEMLKFEEQLKKFDECVKNG